MEAWRSGRSKSVESLSLVTMMGPEDARLASPAFLLGKILQGERVSGNACKEIALQTKSIPSRAATTQGAFGCDVARVARAGWGGASAASNLAALGGAMNSGGRLARSEQMHRPQNYDDWN